MKKSGVLNINVPNPWRSSERRQGSTWVFLHSGERTAAYANLFWPDHDRSLWEVFRRALAAEGPKLKFTIGLGRLFHDEVVQAVAPRALRDPDEGEIRPAPEVLEVKSETNIYEQRVLKIMKRGGEAIFGRLIEATGPDCHHLYIPASEGSSQTFPPEANIKMILENILKQVFSWREMQLKANGKRSEEDKVDLPDPADVPFVPTDRKDFHRLLGVEDIDQVHVLPFGSTITLYLTMWVADTTPVGVPFPVPITTAAAAYSDFSDEDIGDHSTVELENENVPEQGEADPEPVLGEVRIDEKSGRKFRVMSRVRFVVGKKKVMHPITEAYTKTHLDGISTYQGFPGNLSNGWFTKKISRGVSERILFMFGQIGMMFDRKRVNWGDAANERLASGFLLGENVNGTLHAQTSVFMRGKDGRRGIFFLGKTYWENKAQPIGRQKKLGV
jgi:hypothetical protein